MPRKPLSFEDVRAIARTLPDIQESTGYGAPALRTRGRLLACVPVNKSAEPDSLMVRIDFARRAQLLQAQPAIYYLTDHYAPYPGVLVRLSRIGRQAMRALLVEALEYSARAPARPPGARSRPRRTLL